MAMAFLAAADDDDGETAAGRPVVEPRAASGRFRARPETTDPVELRLELSEGIAMINAAETMDALGAVGRELGAKRLADDVRVKLLDHYGHRMAQLRKDDK
jgi:hypothetical protein